MSHKHVVALTLVVTILGSVGPPARGEFYLPPSIRALTIDAKAIVVGEPIDATPGEMPTKYKVLEVLHGTGFDVGGEVLVAKGDDWPKLTLPRLGNLVQDDMPPPQIDKALLFILDPAGRRKAEPAGAVWADVRPVSKSGEMLVPGHFFVSDGPLYMQPKAGASWDDTIAAVRRDLPIVNHVRELLAISDPHKCNLALLGWLREHKGELGGGRYGWHDKGWAAFEYDLFDAIYATCIPEDAWEAIVLSVEVHSRAWVNVPSFCSGEGRKLLLAKIFDEQLAEPLRLTALQHISCFSASNPTLPNQSSVTPEEQVAIIDQLLPLLEHEDPRWRAGAIQALLGASSPRDGALRHLDTKRAVPLLSEMYATERDDYVRQQLAQALRLLEDKNFWRKLTGNPDGIVVFARLSEARDDVLEFDLREQHHRTDLGKPPVFKLQKVRNDGVAGDAIIVAPTVNYVMDRAMRPILDWTGQASHTIPTSLLEPGLWRLTAEGQTDAGEAWHSEPLEFKWPVEREE